MQWFTSYSLVIFRNNSVSGDLFNSFYLYSSLIFASYLASFAFSILSQPRIMMLFPSYSFLPSLPWVVYKISTQKEEQAWLSAYTICHVSLGKFFILPKSLVFICNMRIIILVLTSSRDCYQDLSGIINIPCALPIAKARHLYELEITTYPFL